MMRCWLTVLLITLADSGNAAEIRTDEIATQTAEATMACASWTPVGLCFWLSCSLVNCSVESSLKIGHYNPDFVVSSYNELGQNPWQEIRAIIAGAQVAAANGLLSQLLDVPIESAGNRSEGTRNRRDHKNLIFRETDVIGHPVTLLADLFPEGLCRSQTRPFTPYFLSALDAMAWRTALPESLYAASLIPGLREVGDWPFNTWGSVHPRTGWVIQADEPKAAALTAQRAADIVTRDAQPHIYRPLGNVSRYGQRTWPPGPLIENDASTGIWQMLKPQSESDCAVFGLNDLASVAGWGSERVDEGGDYVWNLWRPYQCCDRRGQLFLFDINWMDFPE